VIVAGFRKANYFGGGPAATRIFVAQCEGLNIGAPDIAGFRHSVRKKSVILGHPEAQGPRASPSLELVPDADQALMADDALFVV
jgi:hypothetical protein